MLGMLISVKALMYRIKIKAFTPNLFHFLAARLTNIALTKIIARMRRVISIVIENWETSLKCLEKANDSRRTTIIRKPIIPARTLDLKLSLEINSSENISSNNVELLLSINYIVSISLPFLHFRNKLKIDTSINNNTKSFCQSHNIIYIQT